MDANERESFLFDMDPYTSFEELRAAYLEAADKKCFLRRMKALTTRAGYVRMLRALLPTI